MDTIERKILVVKACNILHALSQQWIGYREAEQSLDGLGLTHEEINSVISVVLGEAGLMIHRYVSKEASISAMLDLMYWCRYVESTPHCNTTQQTTIR